MLTCGDVGVPVDGAVARARVGHLLDSIEVHARRRWSAKARTATTLEATHAYG